MKATETGVVGLTYRTPVLRVYELSPASRLMAYSDSQTGGGTIIEPTEG